MFKNLQAIDITAAISYNVDRLLFFGLLGGGMEMKENLSNVVEQARQEIRRLKILLRAEEIRTRISSEYSNFGLWEYDIASDTCYQYKKLNGRYEHNLEPIVHFREAMLSWGTIYTEDLVEFNRFCDGLERGDKEVSCEIRVINDNCDIVWFRYEGKAVYDENGVPVKIIGRTIDITQEKGGIIDRSNTRRDQLTGTYSPGLFKKMVAEKRTGSNCYSNGALLSIGIDNFNQIISKFGSQYTEYLEKTIAKILIGISACERDSVLTHVRNGEFLIYLGAFNDASVPEKIAKKAIETVRGYIYVGEPATISVGISLFNGGKKLEQVYRESSCALADAKAHGHSQTVSYNASIPTHLVEGDDSFYSIIEDFDISSNTVRVFDLIIKAFCSEQQRPEMVKAAFEAAGEALGAYSICIYNYEKEKFCKYVAYCSSITHDDNAPDIVQTCPDNYIRSIFGDTNELRIDNSEKNKGFKLINNAVFAECRAIRFEGEIAEYFAVVFNTSFELKNQDYQVINSLESALTAIYSSYRNDKMHGAFEQLRNVSIYSHRIEGFSVVADTFVVDVVGKRAAEHYDLHTGDICYKKIHGYDQPCAECPIHELKRSNNLTSSTALYNENEHRWLNVSASVEINENGSKRYIVSTSDITDCLGKIQMTDSLTGLLTFDAFSAEALRITQEIEGTDELLTFMAAINIADFRRVNEAKGYETGNSILIAIADIMHRCLVQNEIMCRSEGSRFVALMRNISVEEFNGRLSQILNSIQKQIYKKFHVQIYLLVGACDLDDEKIGVMGGLDRAITAQQTIHGRAYYNENIIVHYDGALRDKIKERRFIEANMFSALKNNEFRVYYQPKVKLETGEVVGAEALVRWIRTDGLVLSPSKFVPIFEQNGFISDMDFAIYRQAISDIAKWLRRGIDVPLVSLNMSRQHLGDEHFCQKFAALVDNLGVPHSYIEIEVTESLLTENLDKLIDTVTWLKAKGFRISVDDFGSGYSSLNLITQLPFDTLKIDGGFFLKNDLSEKNRKVINSVVTLAKSLNVSTVSEGVETQTQVDFLRDLGCDIIQGFFYYKPMPSEDFEQVLVNRRIGDIGFAKQ